jgi:predicted ABC-type ATPase
MSSGKPWFVLVAGINGAGKSTFAQDRDTLRVLLDARGPELEVINPDLITWEILRALPTGRNVIEPVDRVLDLAAEEEAGLEAAARSLDVVSLDAVRQRLEGILRR